MVLVGDQVFVSIYLCGLFPAGLSVYSQIRSMCMSMVEIINHISAQTRQSRTKRRERNNKGIKNRKKTKTPPLSCSRSMFQSRSQSQQHHASDGHRFSILSCHSWPQIEVAHVPSAASTRKRAEMVENHPTPMASMTGKQAAEPPAANR